MSYDAEQLQNEHNTLYAGLNNDQRRIYTTVINAVNVEARGLFFIYGHEGIGKHICTRQFSKQYIPNKNRTS